jgi:hypothetical protein
MREIEDKVKNSEGIVQGKSQKFLLEQNMFTVRVSADPTQPLQLSFIDRPMLWKFYTNPSVG